MQVINVTGDLTGDMIGDGGVGSFVTTGKRRAARASGAGFKSAGWAALDEEAKAPKASSRSKRWRARALSVTCPNHSGPLLVAWTGTRMPEG